MNARSALFDVYGDHLISRGGAAPVAALVKMMAALDISAPAVRTAISRMASQQWLASVRLPAGPGYQLTPRATRRLRDAAGRIYRRDPAPWDRRWHLVTVDRVGERARRDRVRGGLRYLGYAPLRDETWISPRSSAELDAMLETEKVRAHRFFADYDGDVAGLAAAAWDLEALGVRYELWLEEARGIVGAANSVGSDLDAFVVRSRLVHEWRKFLFRDPGLPDELLPPRWSGRAAAAYFDEQAAALMPGAGHYVDLCLADPTTKRGPQ